MIFDSSSVDLRAVIAEAFPSSAAETLRALNDSAEVIRAGPNEVVIHQGEISWVTLLIDGHAGLRRTSIDGRHVMPRIISAGDMAGVLTLGLRPADSDVVTLSDATIVRWPADDIRTLAIDDPGFALDKLDHALAAFEDFLERSDSQGHQDAVVRVARVLYRYRDLFFTDSPVLTRGQLPMIVGTSREMTGRVLRRLERREIIGRVGRRGLQLLDPAALEALGGAANNGNDRPRRREARRVREHQPRLVTAGARDRTEGIRDATRWAEFAPSAVLEASPNPIVAVDSNARIAYANPQAETTFGYSRDELLGQPVEMLLPDRVSDRHVGHRNGFIAHPVARPMGIGIDLAGRRKDGTEFPVEISLAPVETSSGVHVFATVVDITARKAAESQLLQAQKLESIGRLAGGIAHDFNNMLFAISGYTEMLQEDLSSGSGVDVDRAALIHSVNAIGQAADRAAALTMQLLAFSRQQVVSPKVLDLGEAIVAIEPMLRPLIGETIKLVLHHDPTAGRIRADPGQFDQILVNLVVNARDAMPGGGTVTIETGNMTFDEPYAIEHFEVQPGPYVMLAVSDTGQGMDNATREHIFEPFFTTKEMGKGTGLGLATIYGIVRQAGGHIWLYSEPGLGSTFKLYFPRDDALASADPVARPRATAGTGLLLVVEDEPAVRDMTTAMLERAGYTVIAVADGLEALATITELKRPIDVLVTDVVMPNMSGLELAEAVLAKDPDVGLVLLSGYTAETVDPSRLMGRGAIFVSKPIASRELLDAIGRAMPVRQPL